MLTLLVGKMHMNMDCGIQLLLIRIDMRMNAIHRFSELVYGAGDYMYCPVRPSPV